MKKGNAKFVIAIVLIMVCSMVLFASPAQQPIAKAVDNEITTQLIGHTNSSPRDGQIVSVAVLNSNSYFLDAEGTVYSYGHNKRQSGYGSLGIGYQDADVQQVNPVRVNPWGDEFHEDAEYPYLTGIDRIWSGHNYAMYAYDYDTDKLWTWGYNPALRVNAAKGPDTSELRAIPYVLPEGVKVSKQANAIAVGTQHVALLDQNGEVWSWGLMHNDDTSSDKTSEYRLGYDFVNEGSLSAHAGEYQEIVNMSGNSNYTATVMTVPHKVPIPLHAGEKVEAIFTGFTGITYVFTSEARILIWGCSSSRNDLVAPQKKYAPPYPPKHQIKTLYGSVFTEIDQPDGVGAEFELTKVSVGKSGNILAIGNDGKVYQLNAFQLVGDLDVPYNYNVMTIAEDKKLTRSKKMTLVTELGNYTYVDIASGSDSALTPDTIAGMAVRSDDTVWVWGNGSVGRLGDGNYTVPGTPWKENVFPPFRTPAVKVETLPGFPATGAKMGTSYTGGSISWYFNHGLMLKNGYVYAWGQNQDGSFYPQMGLTDTATAHQVSLWPRRINNADTFFNANSIYPGAANLKIDANGDYPAGTPIASTQYTFSKEDVPGGNMNVTVSRLNSGLNGKEIIFYNQFNIEYGRATVSGGQASVEVSGLGYGSQIEVRVKTADPDYKYKIWAPALNAAILSYDLQDTTPPPATPTPAPTPEPTPEPTPTPKPEEALLTILIEGPDSADPIMVSQPVGSTYTITPPDIAGYHFVSADPGLTIVISANGAENTVVLTYAEGATPPTGEGYPLALWMLGLICISAGMVVWMKRQKAKV